jgi:hypothetical protein
MADYERLYRMLFNGITDALDAFEREGYESAKAVLMMAQQAAEEFYIEDGEPNLPVYVLPHDVYSGEKALK